MRSDRFSSLPALLRSLSSAGVSQACGRIYREFTQRLLMRIRVEFQDCFKFTIAQDKSKVGQELMNLSYLYVLEKHAGVMLPPQAFGNTAIAHITARQAAGWPWMPGCRSPCLFMVRLLMFPTGETCSDMVECDCPCTSRPAPILTFWIVLYVYFSFLLNDIASLF